MSHSFWEITSVIKIEDDFVNLDLTEQHNGIRLSCLAQHFHECPCNVRKAKGACTYTHRHTCITWTTRQLTE